MESVFPQLFFLSYVAPIIIRLAVAGVFFYDAVRMWKNGAGIRNRAASIGWVVLGAAIGVGFLTQPAVIIAAAHILFLGLTKDTVSVFRSNTTAILALAILLSLLVTGPGGLAFDLPY